MRGASRNVAEVVQGPGEHGICIGLYGYAQHVRRDGLRRADPRTIKEALMKALFAALLFASTLSITACGQRQVEVSTGTQPQSEVAIHLTNNTSTQPNVYVVHRGPGIRREG